MNPLFKNKYFISIIIIWAITSITLTFHWQLAWWYCVLFILSFGGVVFMLDPLLTPIILHHNKKIAKLQKVADHHKNLAKKEGKKDFLFGDKKQHVIWAQNKLMADKIWNQTFTPEQRKSSYQLYWISSVYNNVVTK